MTITVRPGKGVVLAYVNGDIENGLPFPRFAREWPADPATILEGNPAQFAWMRGSAAGNSVAEIACGLGVKALVFTDEFGSKPVLEVHAAGKGVLTTEEVGEGALFRVFECRSEQQSDER